MVKYETKTKMAQNKKIHKLFKEERFSIPLYINPIVVFAVNNPQKYTITIIQIRFVCI